MFRARVTLTPLCLLILSWSIALSSALMFGPGSAFGQGIEAYAIDRKLVNRVEASKPECMPAPYAAVTTGYSYRLMSTIYERCMPVHYDPADEAGFRSNVDPAQFDKYMLLTAASFADPTGISAAYAAGELSSDSLKCILTSMVEASAQSNKRQKEMIGGLVEDGFRIKDWYYFMKGIPELANPDKIASTTAEVETLLGLYDRGPEAASFTQSVGNALVRGTEAFTDWHDGPRKTAFRKARESYDRCEFDAGRDAADTARKLADRDCRYGGDAFRQAELNIRSFEAGGLSLDTQSMLDYSALKSALFSYEDRLRELMDFYEELEEFDEAFDKAKQAFDTQRKTYRNMVAEAKKEGSSLKGCQAIQKLSEMIQPDALSQECHRAFFAGDHSALPYPNVLASDMWSGNAARMSIWWTKLDEIRGYHTKCMDSQKAAATRALRTDMRANPVVQWINGQCRQESQAAIETELDRMAYSVSPNCEKTVVPEEILGKPVTTAERILTAAELWARGPYDTRAPKDGDTPGIVIGSDPEPGASVKTMTGVVLTVIGEFPEEDAPEDLVVVPSPLIGETVTDALTALQAVGLVGAMAEPTPATEMTMVTGQVHSVSPGEGEMVAKKSTVTLTPIGERPLVVVPVVAKMTPEQAKSAINAAGLVAADVSVGNPAPEADKVGEIYSSIPANPAEIRMFTPVSPLIYGPMKVTLIPVPAMQGKTLAEAVSLMAAHGEHFVYGDVALGKERPDGAKLGTVHYSTPAAGEPVPPGTNVTLFFYPPVGEEIGNARMIPVEIIGMPAEEAAALLRGDDGFFVVPRNKDGDAAMPGQVPGTVQFAAPAAGSVGLRGDVVQLFVYREAEPPEQVVPEPDSETGGLWSDGSADENASWIGRWKVMGRMERDGTATELNGMLEITPKGDALLVQWKPWEDGEYKKFMSIPMVADQDNVLRTAPEVVRALAEKELRKNPSAGSIEQAIENSASLLVQFLRTLEISRSGSDCSLVARDPKSGPVEIEFSCTRMN